MTRRLRLDVVSDDLWARTMEAVEASHGSKPTVEVRCAQCGNVVAHVGVVPGFGPMFTSSWTVAVPGSFVVNGQRMSARRLRSMLDSSPSISTAGGWPYEDSHGVIALIEDGLDEYPDLLVRCRKHGDLVLDRGELLGHLHHHRQKVKVRPRLPLLDYEPPRQEK